MFLGEEEYTNILQTIIYIIDQGIIFGNMKPPVGCNQKTGGIGTFQAFQIYTHPNYTLCYKFCQGAKTLLHEL